MDVNGTLTGHVLCKYLTISCVKGRIILRMLLHQGEYDYPRLKPRRIKSADSLRSCSRGFRTCAFSYAYAGRTLHNA